MKAPVFIVGCPRSGTSFLYHLLLSSGGFAEFHTQMNIYDVLEPIYGDLSIEKNKRAALKEWMGSKGFRVSGLDAGDIESRILAECKGTSDFLRIIMEAVAQKQGVDRWIDSTPTNVPHMLRIHGDFPDALFIHIIRDPRDLVLSLDKRGWTRPLPWDKDKSLLAAGLYWEWIVRKARKYGEMLGPQYMEVRYEALVQQPRQALKPLAQFLDHDLDYDRMMQTSIGSIKNPLTSFKEDLREGQFTPVGRWKEKFPPEQLMQFEELVGHYLQELGYPVSSGGKSENHSRANGRTRLIYETYYECKQWIKTNTPLSRLLVNYSEILIDK